MFITCQQNKILKTFTCERLSSNVQNRILIDNVQNERNSNLVSYLKTKAWLEDESGECAHYLIKSNNEIALFFSIRTGCLFDKPVNENELSEILRIITTAINAKNDIKNNAPEKAEAQLFLKQYNLETVSLEDLEKLQKIYAPKKSTLLNEKKTDMNKLLYHVAKTYSAVELFIFCSNDNFKNTWKSFGFPAHNRMGMVLFWKFVVNKVWDIQSLVGCKYLYLFAADNSADSTLVGYYNMLSFAQDMDLGTNKPYFDWQSRFMCQEIANLKERRKIFFSQFNPDDDPIA